MMAAGRSGDGSAARPAAAEGGATEAWIRRARTAASAPFRRLGWMLLHVGRLVGPSEEPAEAVRRLAGEIVEPEVRRKVVASLEGELEGLVDDAAGRGISDRAADALLTIVDILAWLRDGAEPPGWAALGLLEVQVALFNDARDEEEKKMRSAFLDVLRADCRRGSSWCRPSDRRLRRRSDPPSRPWPPVRRPIAPTR